MKNEAHTPKLGLTSGKIVVAEKSFIIINIMIIMIILIAIITLSQGGITCGAIDEPRKSSKAIDEPFSSIDSFSVLSIDFLFYRKLFCSIHSFSVL